MSFLSKAVKKVASVAGSTAAGFVGGGNVGGIVGTVSGIIKNTKTSEAAPTTLGSVGKDVVTGGVANVAAGAILAGGHALLAAGTGVSMSSKIAAFGKSGGVSTYIKDNAGKIISTAGQFLAGGKALLPAVGTPGFNGDVTPTTVGGSDAQDKALGYKNTAGKIGKIAQKTGVDPQGKLLSLLGTIGVGKDSAQPSTINVSSEGAPGPGNNGLVLAGIGILALFMFVKFKK